MQNHPDLDFGPPQADEFDALVAVMSAALHFPLDRAREYAESLGIKNVRAMRRDGRVVAGIYYGWMGQWYGGARVPMVGLCGVGVVPEERGSGVGGAMLRSALEELRSLGVPLSALYPATLPYYQRGGYERAGQRITYELPIEAIDVRDHALDLVPITSEQYDHVKQAYEQRARQSSGNLDRPAWMWQQKLEPKDQQPFRYLVQRDGQTEGYVIYNQGGRTDPLTILDICVLTQVAGRRLLTLFGGYRSMIKHLVWHGGPIDPLLYLLSENLKAGMYNRARVVRSFDWMLRIVDVDRALAARGYPLGLNAELHFDLRDDLLPDNSGRWVLHIADGRGTAQRGGEGRIKLHVRDLASIYTGFMAPAELRVIGSVQGSDADLALLGAVFAGPRPWVGDMF